MASLTEDLTTAAEAFDKFATGAATALQAYRLKLSELRASGINQDVIDRAGTLAVTQGALLAAGLEDAFAGVGHPPAAPLASAVAPLVGLAKGRAA